MMKFLLMVVVLGLALVWWLKLSGRGSGTRDSNAAPRKPERETGTTRIVACAHCGVHLPETDAVSDAERRPFCSEAHRLAGPR